MNATGESRISIKGDFGAPYEILVDGLIVGFEPTMFMLGRHYDALKWWLEQDE